MHPLSNPWHEWNFVSACSFFFVVVWNNLFPSYAWRGRRCHVRSVVVRSRHRCSEQENWSVFFHILTIDNVTEWMRTKSLRGFASPWLDWILAMFLTDESAVDSEVKRWIWTAAHIHCFEDVTMESLGEHQNTNLGRESEMNIIIFSNTLEAECVCDELRRGRGRIGMGICMIDRLCLVREREGNQQCAKGTKSSWLPMFLI